MFRRRKAGSSKALILLVALAVLPAAAWGQGREASAPTSAPSDPLLGTEITEALTKSVDRGLARLAQLQATDGSYGGGAQGRSAGITALAGLAFMQAGNLPGRGKYGTNVTKTVDFVLEACQDSGLINSDQGYGPMYGHGFATLFLAEVYGMTGDERVKEKLVRAVRLIEKVQNEEGGWRYQPVPLDADISVTICQVMGLRAARDAGIKVEKQVIDKAIIYVKSLQNGDGGFSYMSSRSGSAFPRSAAGVASLYYAGVYTGQEITGGLRYIEQFRPGKPVFEESRDGHYYYGHYYAVQAMFLAGGDHWGLWFPAVRQEIISEQNRTTGGWSREVSEDYSTAMALIILQMPNRYLPVYTGKGPGS